MRFVFSQMVTGLRKFNSSVEVVAGLILVSVLTASAFGDAIGPNVFPTSGKLDVHLARIQIRVADQEGD